MPSTTAATRSITRARSGLRIDGAERPAVGVAHRVRDARRLEQRLRRHAAVPQAVAAELVLFDQRDLRAERGAAGRDDQTAGAAADDREIEFGRGHDGRSAGQAGDRGDCRTVARQCHLTTRSGIDRDTACAASMEIPRARRQRPEQRRHVDEPSGEHVHDGAFALDLAVDAEEPRTQQLAALAVAEIAPDDDVQSRRFRPRA